MRDIIYVKDERFEGHTDEYDFDFESDSYAQVTYDADGEEIERDTGCISEDWCDLTNAIIFLISATQSKDCAVSCTHYGRLE